MGRFKHSIIQSKYGIVCFKHSILQSKHPFLQSRNAILQVKHAFIVLPGLSFSSSMHFVDSNMPFFNSNIWSFNPNVYFFNQILKLKHYTINSAFNFDRKCWNPAVETFCTLILRYEIQIINSNIVSIQTFTSAIQTFTSAIQTFSSAVQSFSSSPVVWNRGDSVKEGYGRADADGGLNLLVNCHLLGNASFGFFFNFFFNLNWFNILLSVKQRKRYGMFLLVFQPNQSEFAVELGTLVDTPSGKTTISHYSWTFTG